MRAQGDARVRVVLLQWYCALLVLPLCSSVLAATSAFYPFVIDQDNLSGVVDFSDLSDGPIRDKDRLVVCGTRLCRVGDSATQAMRSPIRLFGVTFAHDAVFPTDAQADMLVARLRRLGINLVRLHGFDTVTDSAADQAQSILLDGPFPTLNPVAVQRLKRFLVKLRDAGIYVDINIHVDYTFRPGVDKVPPAFPGDRDLPSQSKPLYIFNESMSALEVEYVKRLLSALGTSAKNGVAIVEISNEDSLLYEWASDQLHRNVKGAYRAELASRWVSYQKTCEPAVNVGTYLPSRTDIVGEGTRQCFLSFLTHLDRQYLDRMRAAIKSVNPDLLVVGTQMGYGGFQNMKSNSSMDMMDSHVYVDQYGFLGTFADWNTWFIRDISEFDDGLAELKNVAFYRPAAKPYMVSEYNQPWPNRQAAEIIPIMAGLASLQDWSAIVFYSYSETRADWDARTPREYTLDTDFAKLPTVGPMAWIYRTFEVNPASVSTDIPITDDTSIAALRAGVTDDSADFLARSLPIDAADVFSKRVGVMRSGTPVPQSASGVIPKAAGAADVKFDVADRYMLFDTRSAIGFIGRAKPGVEQTFHRFSIKLARTARGFVTFVAISRDGLPVEQSRHMLWVLPGYATGSKPGVEPPVPELLEPVSVGIRRRIVDFVRYQNSPNRVKFLRQPRQSGYGVLAAQAPVWMERVECVVTMPHEFSAVTVYPLDGRGKRLTPLPVPDARIRDGVLTVHLERDGQSFAPWYELVFS
jgi:hypothetical protein